MYESCMAREVHKKSSTLMYFKYIPVCHVMIVYILDKLFQNIRPTENLPQNPVF